MKGWRGSRGHARVIYFRGLPCGFKRQTVFCPEQIFMAEFICRLGTPAGEIVTRTIEAVGVQEARTRLESEGFRVFAVTPPKTVGVAALTRRGGKGAQARFKANDFLLFNQQLAALLRAGIPILQAISMLRKRAQSAGLSMVLADVEDKIRGALAYPTLLLLASFGMVMFLTLFVVPRMSNLFEGFGKNKLPMLTLIVTGISGWLTENFWWVVPLGVVGLAALIFWLRTPSGRIKLDRTLLKVPLVGKLLQQVAVAQATRSLATLLAGGITLVDSWEISAESITNKELRRKSSAILPMVREGRTFTESLEAAGWVPELALDMIGVGERSGSLREMLDEVAAFYDSESEVRLEQLTTTIEPAILIVMGGVVVTILLSIYLPIISAISNATVTR